MMQVKENKVKSNERQNKCETKKFVTTAVAVDNKLKDPAFIRLQML